MSRAERTAKRTRNAPEVRLHAHAQQIRNLADRAPMNQGTRNKLHAIAHGIDELTDALAGVEKQRMQWTRALSATPHQCICPKCGLRHGIDAPDGDF